jgi:hypothetical protein
VCRRDCDRPKDKSQATEDECLNQPDQELQPVKGYGKDHGNEKTGHQHQDFSGSHVAEETKGEAQHPGQVAEDFQEAYKKTDEAENKIHRGFP